MPTIPQQVLDAWNNRNSPAILATVSEDGEPNAIYTAFVRQLDTDSFVITDHYFNKTRDNIIAGSSGSLLFMSPDGSSSYQLKGSFEYHQQGDLYDEIKAAMPPTLPTHAVVIFNVQAVYSGGERLC